MTRAGRAANTVAYAKAWMRQAEDDLEVASDNLTIHPAWSCYAAQQAAEKALKSACILHGKATFPPTHSLIKLIGQAPPRVKNAWKRELFQQFAVLALYEAQARYPVLIRGTDRFGAPVDVLTSTDARRALSIANRIVGPCRSFLRGG
jgi:HEPN domain-containing protein